MKVGTYRAAQLWFGLLVASLCTNANALVTRIDIEIPRDYGYWIGDMVPLRVSLELASPYQLDTTALPSVGRVNHWLWLHPVDIETEKRGNNFVYRITLPYQVLTAPREPERLFLPEQTFYYTDGIQRTPIVIEPRGITVSPLTTTVPATTSRFVDLVPPLPPPPLTLGRYYAVIAGAAAAMLLSIALLGYVHGSLPWVRRTRGPFAKALRQLRRFQAQLPQQIDDASAMRCLHHAFNLTAGFVLLNRDLPRFFKDHPAFGSLRKPIETFFTDSQQRFYGPPLQPDAPRFELRAMVQLCRDCRDVERGLT